MTIDGFRAMAVAVLLVAVAAGSTSAQNGYDLYQQALVKERAKGKLQEAVGLYQAVIKNAGRDRSLAARALIQLAGSYEKMGNREESRKTFERVLSEFADQKAQATIARTRLGYSSLRGSAQSGGRSAGSRAEPVPVRVDLPPLGGPSPDGRYFAFSSDNELAVRKLATGETRILTDATKTDGVDGWQWSHDSKRLLYTWYEEPPGGTYSNDLRVIGVDGTGGRIIRPKVEGGFSLVGWSADGTTAALSVRKDSGSVIQLLSLADGSVRDLANRPPGALDPMSFSTDGKYLVYSTASPTKPGAISILGLDGSEERVLIQDSSENRFIGWTPRGHGLIFASDRSGTWDLWLVHVSNGRLADLPVNLKRDVGPLFSRGVTADGSLYYAGGGEMSDVYTVSLDPKTGRVLSAPAPVRQSVGHSGFPVWSRDGRELAFKSGPSGPIWPTISILSMDTGQARVLRAPLNLGPRFDWSPDSRFFVQAGRPTSMGKARDAQWALYRIDARTGEPSAISTVPETNIGLPRWFPDGRSVAYVRNRSNEVVLRDLDTGKERSIINTGSFVGSYAFSPDASSVAFITARDPKGTKGDIHVTALTDGRVRTLVEYQNHPIDSGCCDALAWSPDSRYIIYYDRTADTFVPGATAKRAELWRIPAAGGPPERLGLTLDSITAPAVSPDGRRLAFMQSVDRVGLWMLRNFLPTSDRRHGQATRGRQ